LISILSSGFFLYPKELIDRGFLSIIKLVSKLSKSDFLEKL